MYLVGLWQVQVGMAKALRAAFRHHHQFRWDPNPALSKLAIYDEFPLAPLSYPNIMVGTGAGNLLSGHRGIGEEFADTVTTPISVNGLTRSQATTEIRSGTNGIGADITIEARSKYEALQIADWCAIFIRSFAADKFQREGLYIQDMTSGKPTQRMVGSDPVFGVTLSLACLTEFSREIPISVMQTVDGICLVGVFSSLPDGTTYGETYS